MKINYLVIEGNIGAGKTTLAKIIANDFKGQTMLEGFADNPFLPKFYKDQNKYAFPLEMSFLADRYNQLTQNPKLHDSLWVSDYYFSKSLIFAQNTLSDDEFKLYQRFFNIIYDKIPKPDLFVYLHQDVKNLLQNIQNRGREYEQEIDSSYLEKISDSYFKFINQQHDFPILFIDISNIDFISNKKHFKQLIGIIFDNDFQPGITRVLIDKK